MITIHLASVAAHLRRSSEHDVVAVSITVWNDPRAMPKTSKYVRKCKTCSKISP